MATKTFIQWFFQSGWKSYTLPYILYAGITVAMILSIPSFADTPVVWICVGMIAYFGFEIGITYHMIDAYKISEE